MTPKALFVAAALSLAAFAGTANAQSPAELNDLEIAHVAYTADTIDIRYAHLALAISNNPAVLDFARTMIRDHTAVNEQALALLQKLNVGPEDTFLSRQLNEQAEQLIAEMSDLSGAAFDRRYAENELGYHKFVNGAVGTIFIPNAKNAELKALLKAGLKVFKVHQGHAEKMVKVVN